ncbi:hypothetical protein BS78_10G076300 [Paspalum vaginatum]|nr:hypothetical protein BS78_10G076300 [Paspalum vaginatum]
MDKKNYPDNYRITPSRDWSLPHLRRKEDGRRSRHRRLLLPLIAPPSEVLLEFGVKGEPAAAAPSLVRPRRTARVPSPLHRCSISAARAFVATRYLGRQSRYTPLHQPPAPRPSSWTTVLQGRPRRCPTTRRRGFREIHGLESRGTARRGGKSSGAAHPFVPLQLGAEVGTWKSSSKSMRQFQADGQL